MIFRAGGCRAGKAKAKALEVKPPAEACVPPCTRVHTRARTHRWTPSFSVRVFYRTHGTTECARTLHLDLWPHTSSGRSPPCKSFPDPEMKVSSIVSASCPNGACLVALPSSPLGKLVITPVVEGSTTLDVVAQLDDGSVSEDSIPLNFVKYEPISVKCVDAFRCPGPHAVFVGARVDLRVRSMVSPTKEALFSDVKVTEAEGIVAIEMVKGEAHLTALKPGVATIHFHDLTLGRSHDSTLKLRVVGVNEAVRGEARLRTGVAEADGLFRADADLVGAEVPGVIDTEAPQLMMTWVLADGTRAIGGAGRVKSPTGQVVVPSHGLAQDDVEHTIFYFNGTPGPVALTASLGTASMRLSFTYTFERAMPPCGALIRTPVDLYGELKITTQATAPVSIELDQSLTFAFVGAPPDVVLVQTCGEKRVLPGPQSNDFAIAFSTDGLYGFAVIDRGGKTIGQPLEVEVY